MKPVITVLGDKIGSALAAVSGQSGCAAMVRPATDAKFGDYQVNGVMPLAKQLKTNPRKLAEQVVEKLNISDICEKPEVAGPGFINLRLRPEFVAKGLLETNKDAERLGVEKTSKKKTIVVDFSGPNIAKQMHVGHLRSTIIGDCICRMLELEGHNVIRQNHIGDWGTQFGRAFLGLWHISMGRKHKEQYYKKELADLRACAGDRKKLFTLCKQICDRHTKDWRKDSLNKIGDGKKVFWPFIERILSDEDIISLEDIEEAYQYVAQLDEMAKGMDLYTVTRKRDPKTGEWIEEPISYGALSRHVTAMLQKGGEDNKQEQKVWDYLVEKTLKECNTIYRLLGVTLDDRHVRGESFYAKFLPGLWEEDSKFNKLVEESDGALCVFPAGFENKEGDRLPLIIGKSDGAFPYAATDLAAVRYRVTSVEYEGKEYSADEIIYVTDARQSLHFDMIFAVVDKAGWAKRDMLHHVTFGSVLGVDGKPLKTREGENVKLKELLDEAVERAKKVVEEKNPELSANKKAEIAKAVGIGAVKYADYSNNRTSDYIFSFDKMLAMDGNTAPYMQYAYARIKSIERKAQTKNVPIEKELADVEELNLDEPVELDLAKQLIRYGEAIESAAADYRPNYLTSYLYELAQKFSVFYTNCPVLDAGPDKRPTRLLLCDLTARTIRHGLRELLGIEVVEQM